MATLRKRYTPQEWAKVRAEYELGTSLQELHKTIGPTPSSITRKAKAEGWKAHGSMKSDALEAAAQEVSDSFKKSYKEQAESTLENHAKITAKLRALIDSYAVALSKQDTPSISELLKLTTALKNVADLDRKTFQLDSHTPDQGETDMDRHCKLMAEMREQFNNDMEYREKTEAQFKKFEEEAGW